MPKCNTCFRHCELNEGQIGFCGGRICRDGVVTAYNYGKLTAAALDPIEKKPLSMYKSGSYIFSIGSFGCNLRCPFCQNSDISWDDSVRSYGQELTSHTPEEVVERALELRSKGNIGIAFTYNEPLIGYEWVRDTAKLAKENGLDNVLVTNGCASVGVLEVIAPYIDAMNIDLKSFADSFYSKLINGNLDYVKCFIEAAAKTCHVELTTLIIPSENDSEDEMRHLSAWIHSVEEKSGKNIPLHVTRFFPRFHMTDRNPTPVETVYRLSDVARERLEYVFEGNV